MTDCIIHTGSINRYGYGLLWANGKTRTAHRWAWIQAHGGIPNGMCVLHRCDNRACVNVDHLFLGTPKDNSHDMVWKGRSAAGEKNARSKLTEQEVRWIRKLTAAGVMIGREIGELFGLRQAAVNHVALGRNWSQLYGA